MRIPLVLLLCVPLGAQMVSPAPFATVYGNGGNTFPLGQWNDFVYQQIHTDLQGSPFNIAQIAVRQHGQSSTYVAHTVDAEVKIGLGSYAGRSTVFANNFQGGPTTAMARKTVNLPDWTIAPAGGFPGPFNAIFVFDAPYTYSGTADLCWQMTVFANSTFNGSVANVYGIDVADYASPGTGSQVQLGVGCLAAGQTRNMYHSLTIYSRRNPDVLELRPSVSFAVANGAAGVILGLTDPNIFIPGLCDNLRVGNIILTLSGQTSGTGSLSPAVTTVPFKPIYVGNRLYGQGWSLDASQTGIPVAVSFGRETTIPDLPPSPVDICRIYVTQSSTATTGSVTDKYGLITEFQ